MEELYHLIKKMQFFVSHIYREGNSCADRLAGHGISNHCFTLWDDAPCFIIDDFNLNRFSLSFYLNSFMFSWVLV